MKQRLPEPVELFAELVGGVAVMVQVDIDVAIARVAEPLELVEVFGLVLVLGEEERVLGWTAG